MGYFVAPLELLRAGGTIPAASLGFAGPDSGTVGVNEHLPLDSLLRYGQLLAALLEGLARV